jgi:tetratricopeptide (TPR) repeat protein
MVEQLALGDQGSANEVSHAVSTSLLRLGDTLTMRGQPGDADRALACYERGLTIAEQIASEDPRSAQAKRDVSLVLQKLADGLAARGQHGDAEQALGHCQRSLTLTEQLYRDSPTSASATRELSMSLLHLARLLAQHGRPGDCDQAVVHGQRSREMLERLASDNPDSARTTRDLSIILEELGDLLLLRGHPGDVEQAFGHYLRSLTLAEQLLAANSGSAQEKRRTALSLLKLADLLASRRRADDAEQALNHYQRSLALTEQLLGANAGAALQTRDVLVCLERLADFLVARGQPGDTDQALAYYRRCLELAEQLANNNPDSVQLKVELATSLERLVHVYAGRGNRAEAWHHQQRVLNLTREIVRATPSDAADRALIVSLAKTGAFAETLGDMHSADALGRECYMLLCQRHSAGGPLDPTLRQIFKQLQRVLGPTLLARTRRWLLRVVGSSTSAPEPPRGAK